MQQAGKEMNPFRPEVLLLRGQLSTVLLSLREAKVRQLSAYTKLLVIFNISNPDNFGSEQNRNHHGLPNYTKDELHWFVKGMLLKYNRPEKK